MRWSKLKSLIEARFAQSVRSHVQVHSAAYGNCTCGHCWITVDGEVVANFCTRAYFNKLRGEVTHVNPMYDQMLVQYGEMSRQGAYRSMFAFVHELGIDEALGSKDPLIQTLAVLDARVGKRRLAKLEEVNLHPLAHGLLAYRHSTESRLTTGCS